MKIYKNKKNGKRYELLSHVTDQTNGYEGRNLIIYRSLDSEFVITGFAREEDEFFEKFEEVKSKGPKFEIKDVGNGWLKITPKKKRGD